jgi:hypothetical protein
MVVKMSDTSDSDLPQMMAETIKKMHRAGQTQEFISAMTGVDLAVVRQVLVRLDEPQLMQAMLRQAQQRSLKYRCAYSGRLMGSPVQASNKKLYEQQVLEALLNDGQMTSEGSSLIAFEFFREEIGHFSKETLELIEVCLVRKVDPETTMSLVSDCLSVLSPESDLSFFQRVFEKVENSQLPQLLELLHSKSSAELMQSLLSRLAETEGLQLTVLAISKLLLRRVSLDFEVFLTVISKAPASSEVLALALEVAELCTPTQLGQLREELCRKNWDTEQWRLDELSFREAEFRVQSGEDAAARELLKTLKGNLAFKDKLLEYFDRVDWKQDKLEFLDEIYSRNMQTVKAQGLSPYLVEVLETLYQITQTAQVRPKIAEYHSEKVKSAVDDLKREQQAFYANLDVQQRKLQAFQASVQQFTKIEPGFIFNFQRNTSNLHKINLSTGQGSSTALTHTFKSYSSLCETPEGNLFITGGGTTSEVVCINPATNSVTPKPPMKTPRQAHGSVFYGGLLYVIGGYNGSVTLAECERYDSFQDKWEPSAPLPHASRRHEAIVCGYTRRIYTLGGHDGSVDVDLIQEFELESQTWKLLEVKLPSKSAWIPCFRVKNQALIYFIQDGALRSFSPITYTLANIKPITNIQSCNGPSYYAKGTLYYTDEDGPVRRLVIGELVL